MYELHGCWFIMMVPTTLFKSVRSSNHEQSVRQHASTSLSTTMFKLANSTMFKLASSTFLQAGQLNHVQTGQLKPFQPCSNCPAQPCSSWPAQPFSTLASLTMFKLANSTMFKPWAQPCSSWSWAQPCSNWPAEPCSSLLTGKTKLCVFTMCRQSESYDRNILLISSLFLSYLLANASFPTWAVQAELPWNSNSIVCSTKLYIWLTTNVASYHASWWAFTHKSCSFVVSQNSFTEC